MNSIALTQLRCEGVFLGGVGMSIYQDYQRVLEEKILEAEWMGDESERIRLIQVLDKYLEDLELDRIFSNSPANI